MATIGEWLASLGLTQYAPLFAENHIDLDLVREMSEHDFEKIGINSFGHRRKLVRGVADLASEAATDHPIPVPTASPMADPISGPGAPRPRSAEGERRHLTVMFCDLVGSTTLAARLDPEDMREIVRAYQGRCADVIESYEGYVAQYLGDGIMAYFGYPKAHEDDAERAVRAGLDLIGTVAKLDTKNPLRVRVGIATGLVVVGDLIGEGAAEQRAVTGETPNLAARLQGLALPGAVILSAETRRLLGGMFDLRDLGPREIEGLADPVPAWLVLGEIENVSRFEASRSEAMTPFIGREHELALLLDRWRNATEGEGQVVLLWGEAGIGKSRILAKLQEQIAGEPHVAMRYQCSPHHSNDALHPVMGQMRHAAGFLAGDPAATRLEKLEAMIAFSGLEADSIAPFLASILSIPTKGRYSALEMAPSELKERTIEALIALFAGLTRRAPVLLLLEDAHWIDPTTLDLFSRLVERLQGLRGLLVVTFRPEFAAPWFGRLHVTALGLNRLGRRKAVAMIDRVTGGKALPAQLLDEIVAKTDGVPLFIEELTKTVLESGLVREEGGSYVLAAALTPLAIPSTLQDSLMSRLDRLAPIREIAQIGAAIGREFSYRLLEAVSPITGPALRDALRQLVAAELIYEHSAAGEASYAFKHALVQDTAYASLLRSRRQRIHANIARILADRFADQVESAPSIIARHYTEAGLAEPAVRSWLAAAELALSRSAPVEADRYIEAGLALISRLSDEGDRQSLELALQLARANALLPLKGFIAPETVSALTAAKRLLDAGVGTDLQRFSVLYGLGAANYMAARMEAALALAHQIVEVADRQDDAIYRLVGYRLLGTTQLLTGQQHEALEALQRAERYRDPNRERLLSYRFAGDPGLAALCYKMWALILLGFSDQAERVREQVRAELSSHGHAPTTIAMCKLLAVVWYESAAFLCDLEACERHSAELIAYCAEKKVEQFRLLGALHHACARANREPTRQNIAAICAALDAHHRSGGHVGDPFFVRQYAEALLAAGDVMGAEAALQEAFAFVEQSGERILLAEIHRVAGRIALERPASDRAQAEACFLRAIDIARSQKARMLELRAATDLARLWRDAGSDGDPRALLEPILAAIEGGETTRDVQSARALL